MKPDFDDVQNQNLLYIEKLNESYAKIHFYQYSTIEDELYDFFSIDIPSKIFDKRYKRGKWDGKLRLFSRRNHTLYLYLIIPYLQQFAELYGYKLLNLSPPPKDSEEISSTQLLQNQSLPLRDYQIRAILDGINKKRAILKCPTGSGKSYIIYHIVKHFYQHNEGLILIVVPSISLVEQLHNDFISYEEGIPTHSDFCTQIQKIYDGFQGLVEGKRVIISTWQSIYNLPKTFFQNISFLCVDECHLASAKSLTSIAIKCENSLYKIGTTGTIDEKIPTHKIVLEGLFGPIIDVEQTHNLIQKEVLSPLQINVLKIQHKNNPQFINEIQNGKNYFDELKSIATYDKRNDYISSLASSLTGNTLILVNFVDLHGSILFEKLQQQHNNKIVHFLTGNTPLTERQKVFNAIENNNNIILIGTYSLLSTGINIVHLHNIIFASSTKSSYRILQSIGRGLRKSYQTTTIYDIIDCIEYKNTNNDILFNKSFFHGITRIEIYKKENFPFKIYSIVF